MFTFLLILQSVVAASLVAVILMQRRRLVRFDFPTLSGPGSRGWLLIERGEAKTGHCKIVKLGINYRLTGWPR